MISALILFGIARSPQVWVIECFQFDLVAPEFPWPRQPPSGLRNALTASSSMWPGFRDSPECHQRVGAVNPAFRLAGFQASDRCRGFKSIFPPL
jgi:hypothetical protein